MISKDTPLIVRREWYGEIQFTHHGFAEIQLVGMDGEDHGFLLERFQIDVSQTELTDEEFTELFKPGKWFRVSKISELTSIPMPAEFIED
jgi:hypothetical protein